MSNFKDNNAVPHHNREAQAFQLLMENVTDYAIFLLDIDRCITSWNVGAERILGYHEGEIIGQSADIIFTPEDLQNGAPDREMRQALEEGRANDERWHMRKDGTTFFASGILTRLIDEEGQIQGFAKILRDLTERQQAQQALIRSNEELEDRVKQRTGELEAETAHHQQAKEHTEKYLKLLVTAQEDERKRIARDLHDEIGQQVTALRLNIEALKAKCGQQSELCEEIDHVQKLISNLDKDIDFLVWELRPANLEQFGLISAIDNYVQEWSKNFTTPAEFQCLPVKEQHITPEMETNLYRIVQEAMNNTAKYAAAQKVEVLLEYSKDEIRLLIEDDGVGFDVQSSGVGKDGKGLGLVGIKERAQMIRGSAEIESSPGSGTTIIVRVPLVTSVDE